MNPYENILQIKEKSYTEAQKALHRAVLELNEEMEIYEISVKKLCEKANVARSTFYAYYVIVDDVLAEIENELLSKLIRINHTFGTYEKLDENTLDFIKENLDLILKNKKIFYLLLVKRPNHRFIKNWKRGIKYHFYYRVPSTKMEQDKELILELIAGQAIAAYTFWLQNPYEVNFNMVKKIILNTLEAYQ